MTIEERRPERIATAVPGLDAVLGGGLWKGCVYLVQGAPGSGKTILANQLCAAMARRGGRALYVSLLAESFTGMLQHLRDLDFFDSEHVGQSIIYISGFSAVEEGGLAGILALLRSETQRHAADLVILDALLPAREAVASDLQYKRRLLDLQALGALCGFTTVLLATEFSERDSAIVKQMADGVIELRDDTHGVRDERSMMVPKFRGSATLRGRHSMRISRNGISIFPRLEATLWDAEPASRNDQRLSCGVEQLDEMLGGGLPAYSTTGVIGAPGSCKTSLGLQFLGASTVKEPGVLFGLFESPESLRAGAANIGVDLAGLEKRGAVRIVWQPQGEHLMDELAYRLLESVDAVGAKRVFIDGLEAFSEAALDPGRISRFMTALSIKLRARGATVLITAEDREVLDWKMELPLHGSSPIFDNFIVVRRAERAGRLVRLVSITKVRGSAFDPSVHAFDIGEHGIEIGPECDQNISAFRSVD